MQVVVEFSIRKLLVRFVSVDIVFIGSDMCMSKLCEIW